MTKIRKVKHRKKASTRAHARGENVARRMTPMDGRRHGEFKVNNPFDRFTPPVIKDYKLSDPIPANLLSGLCVHEYTPVDKMEKPYLPTDYTERKGIPLCTGVLDYFPLALIEVARVSQAGNDQHNPGEELHWARGKSMDQMNTAVRHIMERGGKGFSGLDTDGKYHLAKAIWRLMAQLQIDLEAIHDLPESRGCRTEVTGR